MLSLVLSALGFVALAIAVPYGFGRILPEGGLWLGVNFALSFAVLLGLACLYFVLAYAGRLGGVDAVLGRFSAVPGSWWLFVRLGLMSALIWLPVLVLAVAGEPRRWKEKVW